MRFGACAKEPEFRVGELRLGFLSGVGIKKPCPDWRGDLHGEPWNAKGISMSMNVWQ